MYIRLTSTHVYHVNTVRLAIKRALRQAVKEFEAFLKNLNMYIQSGAGKCLGKRLFLDNVSFAHSILAKITPGVDPNITDRYTGDVITECPSKPISQTDRKYRAPFKNGESSVENVL